LLGSCLIQHGMKEVNPRIRMRWRHAQELTLHFLTRILFHIRQNEEQFVGYRGSRTRVVRTVTSARTGLPIDRTVLPIGRQRVLKMRQQRGNFWLSEPRHRP
jgi:hypothetical protein